MPRVGRLHIPGGCYHVMGRGLERRRVLNNVKDKEDFLDRLGIGLNEIGMRCFAWALMSNHYHLLIQVASEPLSSLMSPLLGGFASSYNRRNRRVGYVFQDRYKSILCDKDDYLLQLVRYIHLNPVKAKMLASAPELDVYPWTGHAVLMGNNKVKWQDTDEVLKHFSARRATAKKRYREFVFDVEAEKEKDDLGGGGLIRSYGGWQNLLSSRKEHEQRIGDERILGDSIFVARALVYDELQLQANEQWRGSDWDSDTLIRAVCAYCDLDTADILSKGRENNISVAKGLICFLGTRYLGLSTHEIAAQLNISQPAVSQMKKKGKVFMEEGGCSVEDILLSS